MIEEEAEEMEIDDSLYSRQRYVLGDSAMHRMAQSSVFVSGLGGLGVEIVKNLALAGVKCITIHDTQPASVADLSSQFFLSESDVAMERNRAEASLHKVVELNPYVTVQSSSLPLQADTDFSFLREYQCVIMTEGSLELLTAVDEFSRSQVPPIAFISSQVRGVYSSVFCDFGPTFTVLDSNGEEPVETFIESITKSNPGVVTCSLTMHGLEMGDVVEFKEVVGMAAINGTRHTVKVMTPYQFSVGDTSGKEFGAYEHGGVVRQVKVHKTVHFDSLSVSSRNPCYSPVDFSKMDASTNAHLAFLALDQYHCQHGRLPYVRNEEDAHLLIELAREINKDLQLVNTFDEQFFRRFSFVSRGSLAPLVSTVGGVVAQEALIALTGKFSPLHQWLYLDVVEVLSDSPSFSPLGDRYDPLRICVGEETVKKLANLRLFMVGCGAIGCEMMKIYSSLGVATGQAGMITVTDNDIIEKSNLNRQFLFRSNHIQKPKSVVAADVILKMNADLNIAAQQNKVFPGTEKLYSDHFFQSQDLVVNALDNLEARRYVDGRCVTNKRPLLESGTMGPKAHVQVIVPCLTESYSSMQDPPDKDIAYCMLKSFPAVIEHTIQWSRDKFEALFSQKPAMFTKFWKTHHHSLQEVIELLRAQSHLDGVVRVVKMLQRCPGDWRECVCLARVKFEKYFNHKAMNLLHNFPLDSKTKDGDLFWQLPRRPPTPVQFDPNDPLHMLFVVSTAQLLAESHGITHTKEDLSPVAVLNFLSTAEVPRFEPSSKHIETDVSAKRPEPQEEAQPAADELEHTLSLLEKISASHSPKTQPDCLKMYPLVFEKDDDANGHIDFITAASNLRATMYSIETADRLKTKLIAGRIVPAIATTTAAVAGLVGIELVKVVMKCPLESYKNAFLNLALPALVLSEPAPAKETVINSTHSFTLWDKWEVRGHKDFRLQDFFKAVKTLYGLEPAMIVHGVKMIYIPIFPGHKKRLKQSMISLLKPPAGQLYVDLTVSFTSEEENEEDVPGPPIRYYF